jgi:hypothetical protein
MQRKVAKSITGGLSTTAGNILDVHAYIFPLDLLMCKILFRAALRLCSLPPVTSTSRNSQSYFKS